MTCQFTMTATLTLPCARTWEDVEYPIEVETVEIFSWIDEEKRGNVEESDIHYIDGEVIDMKPVLRRINSFRNSDASIQREYRRTSARR